MAVMSGPALPLEDAGDGAAPPDAATPGVLTVMATIGGPEAVESEGVLLEAMEAVLGAAALVMLWSEPANKARSAAPRG